MFAATYLLISIVYDTLKNHIVTDCKFIISATITSAIVNHGVKCLM